MSTIEEMIDIKFNTNALRSLIAAEVDRAVNERFKKIVEAIPETPRQILEEDGSAIPIPSPGRPRKILTKPLRTNPILRATEQEQPKKKRSQMSVQEVLAAIGSVVGKHPSGIKSSDLRAALGWSITEFSSRIGKAKEAKIVKMTGTRASALYTPVERNIAKQLALTPESAPN